MFLVDTNVICEPTRAKPSPAVLAWLGAQASVRVSTVSLIEIEHGIMRLPIGEKRSRLTKWLEGLVASPGVTWVAVDAAVARAAGRLKHQAEAIGRQRPTLDLVIAASALVTGSVVATRNTPDFEGLGVPLLNPFTD